MLGTYVQYWVWYCTLCDQNVVAWTLAGLEKERAKAKKGDRGRLPTRRREELFAAVVVLHSQPLSLPQYHTTIIHQQHD